ncbi:hypothetical protein [Desulfurobacterium indicum]|uniref:Outer membrane protein beta-barrel domain-containing protein n=1 Tax=Desulfurobacterium indicum TaxID=1914305 RepID=A0A1R1MKP7_9BACT|nr:hypothetical protein [Desulfurobacterium indicum]OMH40274.1 hypothetical protein BLW93_06200 [Desulfurobacterium indicum]
MRKLIAFTVLFIPSLSFANGLMFSFSSGLSFMDGSSALFKDYPASVSEEIGSFYGFFVKKVFKNKYYLRCGVNFISSMDRVYFYQGDVYDYTLKGTYGSLGAGISFKSGYYFFDAGVDGYFNLSQEVETPYSTYDTDILTDFFPGIHLSTGKYLTDHLLVNISYDRSLSSIFRDDLGTVHWDSFSIGLGFEY